MTTPTQFFTFDFETCLMGPQNLAPKPICFSYDSEETSSGVVGNGDEEFKQFLLDMLEHIRTTEGLNLGAQNTKFDLHVMCNEWPELYSVVCDLLEQGKIQDAIIREKLLNLTVRGIVDKGVDETGKGFKLDYAFDKLVKKYLNKDISEDKHAEDSVRMRFAELDGMKARDYPKEFSDYVLGDSTDLRTILDRQEERRLHIIEHEGFDPFEVSHYRTYLDFHLYRMTMEGVHVNPEEITKIEAMLKEELTPEKIGLLVKHGLVIPAIPESIRYTKAGVEMKDHDDICPKIKDKETKEWTCNCPPKMYVAKKEKSSTKLVTEQVFKLFKENPGTVLELTDKGLEDEDFMALYKQDRTHEEQVEFMSKHLDVISNKADFMDVYAHKDPILTQWAHRQKLQKILTTELPRMMVDRESKTPAKVVHGNFDVLKETGRTSGYASKLYPSANLQNVYSRVRSCYKAPDDHWILSTDYSGLEFVAAAQRAYDLIGSSTYMRLINSGMDPHSYLACQWAKKSEPWFKEECEDFWDDPDLVYEAFMKYKKQKAHLIKDGEPVLDYKGNPKDWWKHYRTSSKPVGLGILGGMGPATIANVSIKTHKFEMTDEEAKAYRDIWREIFPDDAELLSYRILKSMKDYENYTKENQRYVYTTCMGLRRPNCTYTMATNGINLQSNSAEGATLSTAVVSRNSYDKTRGSILHGNYKPWAFVHDEILGNVKADPKIATAVAKEQERIMVDGLKSICPDINPSADSALMLTWSKDAEEARNEEGYLIPWDLNKEE